MTTKKIAGMAIPIGGLLIALFFIPTNELFGTESNSESPSPMMILENHDEMTSGFKLKPISCSETASGLTESRFQITNTYDEPYEVGLKVSFTDNDGVLFEKEIRVKLLEGQTKDQIHLSDKEYDNLICVVQVNDWSEIF